MFSFVEKCNNRMPRSVVGIREYYSNMRKGFLGFHFEQEFNY